MAIVERHVQDLIRIGVADAAQHTWIRQDPLQRMVFAGEAHAEIFLCAVQRLQAVQVAWSQRRLTVNNVQRCPLFRPSLGH